MNKSKLIHTLSSIDIISGIEKIDTSSIERGGVDFLYRISILNNGDATVLLIGFEKSFPLTKPTIFTEEKRFIPHVEPDGFVCFVEEEGLVLDTARPHDIIIESLEKSLEIIKGGLDGTNTDDFKNEFEDYWHRNTAKSIQVLSAFSISPEVRTLIGHTTFEGKAHLIAESKNELRTHIFPKNTPLDNKKIVEYIIFLPLKEAILPPSYDRTFTLEELHDIITNNVTEQNKVKLNRILNKKSEVFNFIMYFKAPNGTDVLFGISIKLKSVDKLFNNKCEIDTIEHMHINRIDFNYLANRGGAVDSITKKKVLLIGCGSVGGFIAINLVKSGIKNITLVDKDKLSFENIYRHDLGVNFVHEYKTEAIKTNIESSVFVSNISVINDTIEGGIASGKIHLKDFDLIISATGNPTINLWLNSEVQNKENTPPVIFSWVDPYGIGGHSILTNNNNKTGCYECLINPETKYNKAVFYADKQSFSKKLTGCSSSFTSFGVLDSERTANDTVRLAVNVLKGNEVDNPIISWKGDDKVFLKEGFKLSRRFKFDVDELSASKYAYKNNKCKICAHT